MNWHTKGDCETLQVVQRYVASLPLNVGDKGAMQAAFEGQCFL